MPDFYECSSDYCCINAYMSTTPAQTHMTEQSSEPNTRYKVGRVLAKYDLLDFHDQLPDRWLGQSGDPTSLRDLAEQINVALVASAMEEAGKDPLDGEAENAYRLLADDEVSTGVRTQQRNRLERAGVDVDTLESDFVTHQAVYTYLTNGLDVSKETEEPEPIEKHEQRIQRLRSRTTAVVEGSLSELEQTGQLSGGPFDVLVDVQVYCVECNTQSQISEFLQGGGCECADDENIE